MVRNDRNEYKISNEATPFWGGDFVPPKISISKALHRSVIRSQ